MGASGRPVVRAGAGTGPQRGGKQPQSQNQGNEAPKEVAKPEAQQEAPAAKTAADTGPKPEQVKAEIQTMGSNTATPTAGVPVMFNHKAENGPGAVDVPVRVMPNIGPYSDPLNEVERMLIALKNSRPILNIDNYSWPQLLQLRATGMYQGQLIHLLLPRITRDVGEISKARQATGAAKYKYRGIDDALNEISPYMVKHGCHIQITVHNHKIVQIVGTKKSGEPRDDYHATLDLALRIIAPDASFVEHVVPGEGIDFGSDKATYKAISGATKYALFIGLMIPVDARDLNDPDSDEGDGAGDREDPAVVKTAIDLIKQAPNLQALARLRDRTEKSTSFTGEQRDRLLMLIEGRESGLGQ